MIESLLLHSISLLKPKRCYYLYIPNSETIWFTSFFTTGSTTANAPGIEEKRRPSGDIVVKMEPPRGETTKSASIESGERQCTLLWIRRKVTPGRVLKICAIVVSLG